MVHSVVTVLSIPSVGHIGELCKSGWTNEDVVLDVDSVNSNNHVFCGGSESHWFPTGMGILEVILVYVQTCLRSIFSTLFARGCSEVVSSVVTRHLSLTVQYIHLSIKQLLTEQRSYFFVCAYVLEQNSVFSALVSRHRDSAQTQNNTQNRPL